MDPEQRRQFEDDETRAKCIKEAKDAETNLQKDITCAARLEGKLATMKKTEWFDPSKLSSKVG